jgi:hypothetical protein
VGCSFILSFAWAGTVVIATCFCACSACFSASALAVLVMTLLLFTAPYCAAGQQPGG